MNGLMSRYKESLKNTPEHIPLSQCKKIKMDLSGLLRYAKKEAYSPLSYQRAKRIALSKVKPLTHQKVFTIQNWQRV